MNKPPLPGLSADEAEIFYHEGQLRVLHNGAILSWETTPLKVKLMLQRELDADTEAQALLDSAGVTDPEAALYIYAKCRFGGFNLAADLHHHHPSDSMEHWECDCATPCPLHSMYMKGMRVRHGILSDRHLAIIRLLATGAPGHSIADQLFVTEQAIDKAKQVIFQKVGLSTTPELIHWATQHNII
jgi:DNA-binding CsgD family transcriptional regulator